MKKPSARLARYTALVCAFLFALSMPASLLLFNAGQILFISQPYKKAFLEEKVYVRLPAVIAREMDFISTFDPVETGALAGLDKSEWEQFITTLLPAETLQSFSEQSLDSFFDFLAGKNSQPMWVLRPLKQAMASNSAGALRKAISNKPACSVEDITSLSLALLLGKLPDAPLSCSPPAELFELAMPLINTVLQQSTNLIPDEYPMGPAPQLAELRSRLNHAQQIMQLGLIAPLLLFVCIGLIKVRAKRSTLAWWGYPLAGGSILGLFLAMVAWPITHLVLLVLISCNSSTFILNLQETGLDVARNLVVQITTPTALTCALTLLAAVALLAVSGEIKSRLNQAFS